MARQPTLKGQSRQVFGVLPQRDKPRMQPLPGPAREPLEIPDDQMILVDDPVALVDDPVALVGASEAAASLGYAPVMATAATPQMVRGGASSMRQPRMKGV